MPDLKNRLKLWAVDGYLATDLRTLLRDSLATIAELQDKVKELEWFMEAPRVEDLERIKELEDANKDKSQLLARCFAEKKKLEATLAYLAEEAANPNDRVIAKKGLKDKNNVL